MSRSNANHATERSDAALTAGRWTNRTVGSTVREIVLITTMFMLYREVRHLTNGDVDRAMSNAHRLVGVERHIGLFSEGSLQRLVLHSRPAIEFLDHYYVFVHFTASFGFMAWVFMRHPQAWQRIRVWFMSVTVAGLVIHVLFPLAPPRMLTDEGFVDTLHVYGPSIYSKDVTHSAANQLAAMPSLHFAWAVIVAAGFISISGARFRWLAVLHPLVTLLAIVATANHYWSDAMVGGSLVVVTIVVSARFRSADAFGHVPAAALAPAFIPSIGRVPVFARAAALGPVRIARLSTFTALPVLARRTPAGRRHDLNDHRVVHAHPRRAVDLREQCRQSRSSRSCGHVPLRADQ